VTLQLLSNDQVTPVLKNQLVAAAKQRKAKREQFLSQLGTEEHSLQKMQTALREVRGQLEEIPLTSLDNRSFSALSANYETLGKGVEICEAIIEKRQKQRSKGHIGLKKDRHGVIDLNSYVYSDLSVTYPVLEDTSGLLDDVRRTRRRISQEIAYHR